MIFLVASRQFISLNFCRGILLLSFICISPVVQALETPNSDKDLDSVVLQLKWFHQFQFAGYYAALHKGFFKEEGLDVTINEGGPKIKIDDEVRLGRANFGVLASELIQKKAQGQPLVLLAVIMQHSIRAIIVRADSDINSPSALINKQVMLNRNEDTEFLAMFAAEGVLPDKIHIIAKDKTANHKFLNGQIDALNGSIGNQPFIFQNKGISVRTIRPITYGIDFYGDSLFTSEFEVKNHPKRVAAFKKATLRGWKYAMANTSEIITLIRTEYNPKKTRAHLEFEADAMNMLILPELVDIGHINPHRITRIANTYAKSNVVPQNFSLEGFIYNPSPDSFSGLTRQLFLTFCFFTTIAILCVGILIFFNKKLKKEVALQTVELSTANELLLSEVEVRKETEKALRENETRLKVIFDQAAVGVAQVETKTGKFIRINKKYCEIVGYTAQEMTQLTFMELSYPDDLKQTQENMNLLISGDISEFSTEIQYLKKDGANVWVNLTVSPMWEIGKHPNFHIAIIEDISIRKQFEQKLAEKISQLKIILTNTPVMLSAVNMDGKFILSEGNELEGLGRKPGELVGMSVYDVYKNRPDIIKYGEKARSGESINTILDISEKTYEVFFEPLRDNSDEIKGVVVLSINITDRKQAEEEKQLLEEQLRQSHKMEALGTLSGGIAHDFNNILAAILGYAEIARDDILNRSPAIQPINEVIKAGIRAKDLIKHILAFSRQEIQERIPLNPHHLISDAIKLLSASIPSNIQIQQNINTDCGNILAEPTKIHQILMNLCTNAAQAITEEQGIIQISLKNTELKEDDLTNHPDLKPGPYIHLSVKDTGCGIDQKIVERIFDPYFTTKEVGKGSGMGLAVVHGIIQSHEGMITVKNRSHKGTSFNVYLPTIDEHIPKKETVPEPLHTGNERILLVDDDPGMADMTKRRVERLGYQVTAKNNSIETLNLFRAKPDSFDLVITDQTMPNLTGEQLAKELLLIKPDLPIILCTGYSSTIDAQKAKRIGIREFIMKPVDKLELAKVIRQTLDEKHTTG